MSMLFNKKYRVNPVTSKILQQSVINAGGGWGSDFSIEITHLNEPFIFVYPDGHMTYACVKDNHYFNDHKIPEGNIVLEDNV